MRIMKKRRNRPGAFLKIDLPDFIEAGGHISEPPDAGASENVEPLAAEQGTLFQPDDAALSQLDCDIRNAGNARYVCQKCSHLICNADQDPKSGTLMREVRKKGDPVLYDTKLDIPPVHLRTRAARAVFSKSETSSEHLMKTEEAGAVR